MSTGQFDESAHRRAGDGKFVTTPSAEAVDIDLGEVSADDAGLDFLEQVMGVEINREQAAEEVARFERARHDRESLRNALAVGDVVTSRAGQWEIVGWDSASRARLRLSQTAPDSFTKVGTFARASLDEPLWSFADPSAEEAAKRARKSGRPVPFRTANPGLLTVQEGVFGAQSSHGEHVRTRTWATGDPNRPYVTVQVAHSDVTLRADDPQWAKPMDMSLSRDLVDDDPTSFRHRCDKCVQSWSHKHPDEFWSGTRETQDWATVAQVVGASQDASGVAHRHALNVDWREYEHLAASPQRS